LIADEESNHNLHSRTVITANLSIDQSFGSAITIDGTTKQEIILGSNYSKISLISDRINPRSISEREGINRDDFFPSIYICHFEDQFEPIEKRSYGTIIQMFSVFIDTFRNFKKDMHIILLITGPIKY
jgi:hypothetical protein